MIADTWTKKGRRMSMLILQDCVWSCGSATASLYSTTQWPSPRFTHPKIFTSTNFIHWLLSNGMLCPNMLYVYQILTLSRRQLADCKTPDPRSNVVFNLILSHKTIFKQYCSFILFHSHLLSVLISTNILAWRASLPIMSARAWGSIWRYIDRYYYYRISILNVFIL